MGQSSPGARNTQEKPGVSLVSEVRKCSENKTKYPQ